jgi:16S rRNA processing protein RimM
MTCSGNGDDLVAVGRITGAHGIRGEVKVQSLTDYPQRFDQGGRLLLVSPEGEIGEVEILQSRLHKGRFLLQLAGVPDRTAAEKLRGSFLKIPETDLMELPEGQFYHHELASLAVVTEEGEPLGTVTSVFPTGSNLVLEVRSGEREVLIPFIDDVIRSVDLELKTITVHLMPGLMPQE